MAAEVPVKDVLCEAMEYLSKLGSNLRTRTENLKEKKIRKDRLNNAIAVQKAANKVLLICELSKKSLENVETGVRKILQRVDVSQAPLDGGNSSKTKITSNNLEKPYLFSFVYKSKKLKIRKKVNLKHFMSVKVMAKKMPISMLKKYPIYYDCKLYRLKKKWEQKKSEKKSNDKDSEKSTDKNEDSSPIIDSEVSASHSAKNKSDDEKDDKHVSDDEKVNKHRPRDRTKSRSSSHKSGNTPTKDGKKQEEESSKISKYRSSKDSDVKDDEFVETSRKKLVVDSDDSTDKKDESSKRTKKRFKSAVIDSSEDEENKEDSQKIKSQKNDDTSKGTLNDFSMDYDESPKVVDNNVNIDTSIPSPQPPSPVETTQPEKNSIDDESKNDSIQEPEAKKRKTSSCDKPTDTDVNNDVVTLDSSDDEPTNDKDRAKTPENNGNEIKPMIKLVSLSKLLKPNIKPKDVLGHSPKVKDNKKYEFDKNEKKARKLLEEEAYWAKKRIEVKAFKSKKFTVNVARLPKLSSKFLQKHKLKKITQNGKTVHEIEDEKEKSLERNGSNSDNEIQAETDKVKNALLNDSDSDAFEDNYSSRHKYKNNVETKTAKDLLLNDSDSNSSQRKTAKENEKAKRKMILATDSEKSDNENDTKKNSDKIAKDNEKAKRKMILGTDSEKSDNENNTKKNSDKENETQNVNDNENDTQNKSDNENETQNKSDKENDTKNKSDKENDTKNKSDKENDTKNKSDKENDTQNKSDNENDTKNKSDIENDTQNKSDNENNTQNKSDNENDTQSNSHKENGSRNNSDNEQNDETGNKSDSSKDQDGQITPKKSLTPIEEENAKELLLNNSSDDKTNTPLKQRKNSKPETPQSKKKNIRESIRAKKMLLTYSSSSETDDEQLRKVLRNIKDDLLKEISDEDETKNTKRKDSDAKSDESTENLLEQVKKKMTHSSDSEASRKISRQQDSKKKRKMVRSKSKPGNCSSQNSDTVDSNDKEIDGLTNLNNLTKTRRRNADDQNDSETQGSTQSNSRSRNRASSTVVTTGLLGEEMLKAESDSDDATGDENEVVEDGDDEVMPSVSFNGVGIQHLAKDDLLGESDSSTSQNEKTSETNKEDSDEEEKLNSKRRKANAISSDSEAGSSRKKDKDVRVSDFEDSEDESSEPMKRSKRKKKGSESDGSAASSNEGGKKKRRRIKQMDSDASGSETENEGRNKHGRKNIRKVMGKNQLEEATKKAAREERERCARIAERQKLYNNLEFDETGKPDEVVLEKVVLDFDSETKEPLIEVDRGLVKKLKPHQANGIKFMWNACFESVKRIKKDKGSGCILAHCMGLGKTLQVVTLTHTLLTHSDLTKVNRVLVVCPLSTVLNWVNEFKMWLKYAEVDYEVDVYELSRFKQNSERAFQLSQWFDHGGVCVLGYEMFRNLSADNNKKFKKKMLKNFQEALVDPGPDLVVCDEGHLLKNEKTSLSQSMNRVKTLRRIVLTGTPLQNNLKEYYCMVQFVKPNLLGKYNEYLNRFVNPITNGQYTDSTEHDIKIMKRRSHVLHKMLDGSVQRRDYGVLAPFLPPKHEYVLFITLTEVQIKLYQFYLENYSRRPLAGKSSGFLFPDFQSLQRIWTHPLVLKYNSERYEIMQQKKREREEEDSEGSLVDFIDDDSTPEESSEEEMTDDLSDLSDDSGKKSKKKKNAKKNKGKESKASAAAATRRGTRANPREQEEEEEVDDVMEVKNDNPTEWWIKMVTDDEIDDMRNSHKLILLFDILRQCEAIGDKLLVFSQSLYSLDLIEHFLGKVDEATQEGRVDEKLGGHVGSWSPGVDYFRLDGSTSCENRSIWCKNFNREDNPRARLFLISTRAGGLGINLVAANRVVIFDVSWNPSHDVQSIFRVYRFGQKKPCYVYRFLAMGTMEEKIYERQVTKQAISKRVIDEQQIDRHYAENDLAELYKFEPQPPQPRPIPPLPKDRLFAEMLKEHEAQIYKYHEHDSLLENKEEETLSEEERKAAWEDFENEKNRPPPAPFVSPWPMHNGMVPGLLAQQQQQLAYAALAAMIRKDMPNVNDNQIRDMLPLIYNANPGMFGGYDYGLMQKMNEVYKYAQPGMMNPMMTAMNSASGGGAMSGMGGTSGLQYEPPWQRQQQMRLQQLMQQQNQMGAKFYAGGLGSRDPVAMALQQQRAREIMLSGGTAGGGAGAGAGAGRPRGRPPMQPRLPPAATGDVVNLDSD